MTDDLDAPLRRRLDRLAAAVPVDDRELASAVSVAPVRVGLTTRRMAVGLVPVLAIVVIGTLVAGIAMVGPFAPAASPANGPVSATTRSGEFELTIRSDKAHYVAGEPIDISASLTYLGRGGPIEIGHDIGQDGSPIGFGVLEPIFEGYHLSGGVSRLVCHASTLTPLQPIISSFAKTGGGYGGDSAGFVAYMRDPVLWLNEGTWHPYAIASFSMASGPRGICGEEVRLVAEIAIRVVDPALESQGPTVQPTPEATSSPVLATVRDGDFELTIRSSKSRYAPGEAIDVSASLVYRGPMETVDIWPLGIGFGTREPIGGGISVDGPTIQICTGSTLERDVPRDFALRTWRTTPRSVVPEPVPLLPEGSWHVYAGANASCNPDPAAERFELRAEITIDVTDDAVVKAPTPVVTANPTTGPDWSPSPVDSDGIARADALDYPFELHLEASSDSGFTANTPIELSAWYAAALRLETSVTVSHFEPEMAFTISQVSEDARIIRRWVYDSACQPTTLFDGLHRDVHLTDAAVMAITAATWPPTTADALKEGILQLPAGRWRITAGLQTTLGPCGAGGETRQLHASIVIDVVSTADAEIGLATGHVPTLENGRHVCLTALGGGILALNPRTGLGFTNESGTVMTDVVWPTGYTARYEDGRAILLNDSGYLVAAVGDSMSLGGGYSGDDRIFHVCGAGIAD
jgi:hypothetical protein